MFPGSDDDATHPCPTSARLIVIIQNFTRNADGNLNKTSWQKKKLKVVKKSEKTSKKIEEKNLFIILCVRVSVFYLEHEELGPWAKAKANR